MLSERRAGELSAFGAALLWSLFPIVTVATVSFLTPLYSAAIGVGIAAVFFACVVSWRKEWHQLLIRQAWKDMLIATFFIGIMMYGLVFIGYRYTTPGNGALMSLTEVFFTFIIVNLITKHERFVPKHAVGALLMITGAAFILIPKHSGERNIGDLIILCAMIFPPFGNIAMQKARKHVSAAVIMLVRSGVSAAFLFLLALIFESIPTSTDIVHTLWLLLLNGVFLLGASKILWLEAIHRIPLTKTIALTEIGLLFTLIFAYFLLDQSITSAQAISLLPMLGGVLLLTRR